MGEVVLFNVAAPINALNPIRTLAWNAALRAGDDIKIAFTLLDDDCETPISVRSANALMSLYRQDDGRERWDYGWCRDSWSDGPLGTPSMLVSGIVLDDGDNEGRINFFIPAASSLGLCAGRYRALISVDQPYGVSTEIDGLIQIRPVAHNTLGNATRRYYSIGQSGLGTALLPPQIINGIPCDVDGFPLPATPMIPPIMPPPQVGDIAVLGRAVLGQMVLVAMGQSEIVPQPPLTNSNTSGGIGLGAIGLMQMGVS